MPCCQCGQLSQGLDALVGGGKRGTAQDAARGVRPQPGGKEVPVSVVVDVVTGAVAVAHHLGVGMQQDRRLQLAGVHRRPRGRSDVTASSARRRRRVQPWPPTSLPSRQGRREPRGQWSCPPASRTSASSVHCFDFHGLRGLLLPVHDQLCHIGIVAGRRMVRVQAWPRGRQWLLTVPAVVRPAAPPAAPVVTGSDGDAGGARGCCCRRH
jgi:hypothetical protein